MVSDMPHEFSKSVRKCYEMLRLRKQQARRSWSLLPLPEYEKGGEGYRKDKRDTGQRRACKTNS